MWGCVLLGLFWFDWFVHSVRYSFQGVVFPWCLLGGCADSLAGIWGFVFCVVVCLVVGVSWVYVMLLFSACVLACLNS